jgi:uncharacterized protein (TIGR02246 family)
LDLQNQKGEIMAFKHGLISIVALLALAGCTTSTNQPAPSTEADQAQIDKLRDAFIVAFNAGDAEAIADLYAPDAVVMPQNQQAVTGHDAIVNVNKAMFDQYTPKISITSIETKIFGDVAFDRGTYTIELTPKAEGNPISDEGKYLIIIQRQADGSWKVIRDIDNTSKPAPPPVASQ